jgi:hypothetical protein
MQGGVDREGGREGGREREKVKVEGGVGRQAGRQAGREKVREGERWRWGKVREKGRESVSLSATLC